MRAAILLLALGGCVIVEEPDPGGCADGDCGESACESGAPNGCSASAPDACERCGGQVYECLPNTDEWRPSFCELETIDVEGPLGLEHHRIGDVDCFGTGPHAPFELFVNGDAVTAEAPVVVTASSVDGGYLSIELTDDWGDGITPSVVYTLEAAYDHEVTGTATATSGDCSVDYEIWGLWGYL